MSIEASVVQVRRVHRSGVSTPILVPSFSSRGFPDIAELFRDVSTDLRRSCLLSAFDLACGALKVDLSGVADLVLIDSGVFETTPIAVAVDGSASPPATAVWTRDMYHAYLASIPNTANALVVSFDHYGDVHDQLERAAADFALAPAAARDFLLKPLTRDAHVGADLLSGANSLLDHVDVLGVTEKELGDSVLERCTALIRIRRLLSLSERELPIHVFGAITPGSVLAYFMCGADIFDGLNWLRYEYGTHGIGHIQDAALVAGDPSRPDDQVILDTARANIRYLHRLQDGMARFAEGRNVEVLAAQFPVARRAFEIANIARASILLREEH